jgi:hypothetical protein
MDRHDLETARGILKVAHDGRALQEAGGAKRGQRRSVTEGISTVVQRDEPVSLRCVEPLDCALRGRSCERSRTVVVVICHSCRCRAWPDNLMTHANSSRPRAGALTPILRKRLLDSQRGMAGCGMFLRLFCAHAKRERQAEICPIQRFRCVRKSPRFHLSKRSEDRCPVARISPPTPEMRRFCSI